MPSQVVDSDFARPANLQPPPEGFAEAARNATVTQLRRLYRRSDHVVLRWLAEAGIARTPHRPSAPPPDLFERAAAMHLAALCRHYRVTERRVRRWLAETGAEPLPFVRQRKASPDKPKARRGRPKRARPWPPVLAFPQRPPAPPAPPRDCSPEGRAADHLRRFAPCYRCDADGRASAAGGWWRYGNVVLAPDALRLRAARLGWRDDRKES